jgi:hypothetical protein
VAEGLAEAWTIAALIGDGAVREALHALADWPLARWLRQSGTAYIYFNAGHVLAIGVLLGSILLLDARLLGAFGRYPIEALGPPLATTAVIGAAAAIVTGFAIFTVRPDAYLGNPAFTVKLALLALALANALALRLTAAWRNALDFGEVTPPVRVAAALSLILWPATLLAGRWIAFL